MVLCFYKRPTLWRILKKSGKMNGVGKYIFRMVPAIQLAVLLLFLKIFLLKSLTNLGTIILILEVHINNESFLLINLYNANSELDQIAVLDLLCSKIENLILDDKCKPIFGGPPKMSVT